MSGYSKVSGYIKGGKKRTSKSLPGAKLLNWSKLLQALGGHQKERRRLTQASQREKARADEIK